jgi:hypothetical protein
MQNEIERVTTVTRGKRNAMVEATIEEILRLRQTSVTITFNSTLSNMNYI